MAGVSDEEGRRIRMVRRTNVCDYLWNVVPKSYKWVGFTATCPIRHYADSVSCVRSYFKCFVRANRVRYVVYCVENGPHVGWHIHGIFCVQGAVPRGVVRQCFLAVVYHQQFSRRVTPIPPTWDPPNSLLPRRRCLPTALKWIAYMVKWGPCFTMTHKVFPRRTPSTEAIGLLAADDPPVTTEDAPLGEAVL